MPVSGSSNGASTEAQRHEAHIRALLEELDKCERAGKEDRVKAIKAELGEVAKDAATPQKRSEKRPANSVASER